MHSYDLPRRILATGLAALAGFVDATGYVASNSHFVSFMSGNSTRMSVDLVTHRDSAAVAALLIGGFVIGVTLGALLVRRAGYWRKTVIVGTTALLIALSAIGRVSGIEPLFLGASVLAMGTVNNAYQRQGEVAFGLTYITGALVRFGEGLAAYLCGETRTGWFLNLVLWASLAAGAVCGAWAATSTPDLAPWASAALAALLTGYAFHVERSGRGQPR